MPTTTETIIEIDINLDGFGAPDLRLTDTVNGEIVTYITRDAARELHADLTAYLAR